jgi:hypothetical protein
MIDPEDIIITSQPDGGFRIVELEPYGETVVHVFKANIASLREAIQERRYYRDLMSDDSCED